jgi:hypothetical protein
MENNDLLIPVQTIEINKKQFQKMMFLTNAVEQGWTVKKSTDKYVFTKKHENRIEYFDEKYLENFLVTNFSKDILADGISKR